MKSKLSAALAAAGCVLAVSPAFPLTITYNHFATMSSVPGAVLFDNFDTVVDTIRVAVRKIKTTERRLRPEISS